jgi:hypothetical protein
MRLDPLRDFSVDCLSQHPLSAVSQDVCQDVLARRRWQRNNLLGILSHGGVLLGENGV